MKFYLPVFKPAELILKKYQTPEDKEDDYVLPIYSNQTSNLHLKKIGAMASISKSIHFHMARHTFATLSITEGMTLESIAEMLGHTSTRTTKIYAKVTHLKLEKEIKEMEETINSVIVDQNLLDHA